MQSITKINLNLKDMKKIRRLLGLYTEAELVAFGNVMANKKTTDEQRGVWHSDLENFKRKYYVSKPK